MCKTFNDVPLSFTYPSRINLTQTNNFTVKSVEGVFHSFDSLIACRCNDYLQNIRNSTCWQLKSTALILSRLFKNNWTRRHRSGDNCTHSPPTNCASRHPLHHHVRHTFQPRRTVTSGVNDQWQDLPNPKMFNNGHTFIMLIVVEKFWNFAWAEPLKNKTSNSTLNTFAKILSRGGLKTLFLYTDRGLKFANKPFQL